MLTSGFKEKTLATLCRLVAYFAAKHSIPLKSIVELLKKQMVLEAERELAKYGEEVNASRVSLITGIHRAEVQKVLSHKGDPGPAIRNADLLSKIVGTWCYQKPFCKKRGEPKPLSYQGEQSDFSQLVGSTTQSLSAYTILRELERLGSVELSDGYVTLLKREIVPVRDIDESLTLLERDLINLVDTVEFNITSHSTQPMLHFTTELDNIPQSMYEEVKRWLLEFGQKTHEQARNYLAAKDLDYIKGQDPNAGMVVSFSTFGIAKLPQKKTILRTRKRGRKKLQTNKEEG